MAENRELARCATCRLEFPLSAFHRGGKKNGRTSSCKACQNIYASKWRQENRARTKLSRQAYMKEWRARQREHIQEYAKQYAASHRESRSDTFKVWYAKNIQQQRAKALATRNNDVEVARAKCRVWYEKNKDRRRKYKQDNRLKYRASWQRRRARARSAEGRWTSKDIEALFVQQDGLCAYCCDCLGEDFQVDHVIPLARGGSNWPGNLALACPSCNRKKSARLDMKPLMQVSHD